MLQKIKKKLKLHRMSTVLLLVPRYWNSSKKIAEHVNAKSRVSVFFDLLSCFIKYGASDENYLQFRFYGKDHSYRDSFITWRRTMKLMRYTPNNVVELFLDKARFNKRFAKYIHRHWLDCNTASEKQIFDFAKNFPSVIIKPMDAACGFGISKFSYNELLSEGVKEYAGKNFIIEETIENCEEIKKISPKSLNTIRITTLTDKYGDIHVLTTNLRVGSGNSVTDNFCAGGICCCIDKETSKIKGDGSNVNDIRFKYHPYSHIEFNGYNIPRLKEAINMAVLLAKEEPSAKLVGWDMVIAPDFIDVIEGNIPPGEETVEFDLHGKWYFVKNII